MTTGSDSGPAVPPYAGRQTEAHTETETEKDGVRTAGATAPVSDDQMKASPPPADATSPADEQPASEAPDGGSPAASTGPSHTAGTSRAEDQG